MMQPQLRDECNWLLTTISRH